MPLILSSRLFGVFVYEWEELGLRCNVVGEAFPLREVFPLLVRCLERALRFLGAGKLVHYKGKQLLTDQRPARVQRTIVTVVCVSLC